MADFEGLIRQALNRQNDADPAIREKVYQSSRRALAKMIASAGVQPPEVINRQRQALEDAIQHIEAGYANRERRPARPEAAPPEPPAAERPAASRPAPVAARKPQPDTVQPPPPPARESRSPDRPAARRTEPQFEPPQPEIGLDRQPRHTDDDTVGPATDESSGYDGLPDEGSALRRRVIALVALIVVFAAAVWLVYLLVGTLLSGGLTIFGGSTPTAEVQSGERPADGPATAGSLVTLLSPTDTSALETAGRGTAEIVDHAKVEMIRLVSLRPQGARDVPAEPIRIRISAGLIPLISGKRVQVVIRARSGLEGPASFAVGCEFAGEDLCGRKRFSVGIQPDDFLFEIDVSPGLAQNDEAYLAISTDVGDLIDVETGRGDPVDIVHVMMEVVS